MESLCELYGVRHVKVLPYQPSSNGAVEAAVKKVSGALQRHCNALRDWDRYLQLLTHAHRAASLGDPSRPWPHLRGARGGDP